MKSMAFGIYDHRIMCRTVACCCILLKKFKIELNISLKGIILGSQNANRLSLEKGSIAINICVTDICHCVNSKIIVKQENRSLFYNLGCRVLLTFPCPPCKKMDANKRCNKLDHFLFFLQFMIGY